MNDVLSFSRLKKRKSTPSGAFVSKIMAAALVAFVLFASHVAAVPNEVTLGLSADIFRKIPITRCCGDGEFYSLATGTCKEENFPYSWPPPVHSTRYNHTIIGDDLRPFDLTERLETCSDEGNGVFVSVKFTFYEDGTLLLPDGSRLLAGEFCLNPADVAPEDPRDGPLFLARYCAEDPCNTTSCLKKCCPNGMAMNVTANKCQASSIRFQVDFKNETGHVVRPEPFVLRDGNAPLCKDGMYVLDPSSTSEDEFYILADGRLYQPSAPETYQYNTIYCVENFFGDDSSVIVKLPVVRLYLELKKNIKKTCRLLCLLCKSKALGGT